MKMASYPLVEQLKNNGLDMGSWTRAESVCALSIGFAVVGLFLFAMTYLGFAIYQLAAI